jgi:hypothetical protein
MADDGDAQVLQVHGRQVLQKVAVDFTFEKRGLALSQPGAS